MKKIISLSLIITYLSATANTRVKNMSQFTGDLNGDGYIDLVISSETNYINMYGTVKVFFGSYGGISDSPGWTYNCGLSNFLESKYLVRVIGDTNGDGMDELALLLTNLSDGNSGRSHQDIYIFYGRKDGLGTDPEIIKIEKDNNDKFSLRDFFGFDYNGDGYVDILAVSTKRNYPLLKTTWNDSDRKLVLFRGSSSGVSKSFETIREIYDITIIAAGDVNNDGCSDILIGEPASKGVKWIQYLGSKNNTPISKAFLTYKLPFIANGDKTYNNFAGDYNGDSFDDDYIMYVDRSPLLSLKKTDSTVYRLEFYSGSVDGLKDSLSYTWSYKTAPETELRVTSCGDLNKDGFGDFVLQHFIRQPNEATKMKANLLWGSKDGLHLDTTDAFNKLFNSAHLVGRSLYSIIALGDTNNDGCADILLGLENIAYGNEDGNFKMVQLKFID